MCKTAIKGLNSYQCLLKNGSSLLSRIDSIIQSIPLCIQLLILYFIFLFWGFHTKWTLPETLCRAQTCSCTTNRKCPYVWIHMFCLSIMDHMLSYITCLLIIKPGNIRQKTYKTTSQGWLPLHNQFMERKRCALSIYDEVS